MKVSKIFGCVLGLHLCIITVLIMQPGCQSAQPPTQSYKQDRTIASSVQGSSGTSDGLEEVFNAGLEAGDEFSEFDSVAPLEPLTTNQTVDIAGPSFETYTIQKGDNLWSIAKRYNVSLSELYAANGLNKNSVLRIGQEIQIPLEGDTATVSTVTADQYQPSGYNQASTTYTVERGDTLSRIARKYDTTVRAIKAANGKSSDMIRVGESLIIPVGGSAPVTPAPAPVAAPATTTVASPTGTRFHTVQAGEYPAKIARQYGMTTSELLAMNSITDPRKLQLGQQIRVSGTGSAVNVDSSTETVLSPAPTEPITVATPALEPSAESIGITVVEADPLVEAELPEVQSDDVFDNAVEIPVIRLTE
ncbi:MAG: LysM peptidoglycan-binding domain-containing protein [Opitutales bacterium]